MTEKDKKFPKEEELATQQEYDKTATITFLSDEFYEAFKVLIEKQGLNLKDPDVNKDVEWALYLAKIRALVYSNKNHETNKS